MALLSMLLDTVPSALFPRFPSLRQSLQQKAVAYLRQQRGVRLHFSLPSCQLTLPTTTIGIWQYGKCRIWDPRVSTQGS
jgi:hypothetical protein